MLWIAVWVTSFVVAGAAWRMPFAQRTRILIATGTAVLSLASAAVVLFGHINADVVNSVSLAIALSSTTALLLVATVRWRSDWVEADRLRSIAQRNADQVSVLSHEVRTPLSLIRGATDLLLEGTPGPINQRQHKYLETVRRNCEAVISLAEDLLTQARIDAGLFELRPQVVKLRPLAQSVVRELRELHTIQFSLDSPGAPPQVWADPALLRQVLVNLINNAITHSHNADLITVRLVTRDNNVLISVSDDGEGIDEEQRRRLFERFASGRPLRNGTGLGLVITRQIVQMHGGTILVDSVAGGGTTMMVSLPSRSDPWMSGGRTEGE